MKTPRGFTLIEVVVVLFIVGVLAAMALAGTRALTQAAQRNTSTAALQRAADALNGFLQMTGRLPCPADGALPSSDPNAGREQRAGGGCTDNQARGVLPWVSLGMKEDDMLDGYAVRITYRGAAELVADDAMRYTACDAAGKAGAALGAPGQCALACVDQGVGVPDVCTPPGAAVAGRGLLVVDASGNKLNDPLGTPATGAAYLLISHGANRGGGYGVGGVPQEATGTLTAAETQHSATSALLASYTDENLASDDVLMRPTVLIVANRAGLGPRNHRPQP